MNMMVSHSPGGGGGGRGGGGGGGGGANSDKMLEQTGQRNTGEETLRFVEEEFPRKGSVQQLELSVIFGAALLTTQSEDPVTSPAVSAQPPPPIIPGKPRDGVCATVSVFPRKNNWREKVLFVGKRANKTERTRMKLSRR
ncbi:unnamed protein product [Pleuronectes platessa]|uniref:Uncharacterized protein n=1 Tax=Pleuronectes platessa TaxID=8262 RepID=A0A9N7ZDC3_PLEPL|nr:unnamed protein product [Pleuronectes platessa]